MAASDLMQQSLTVYRGETAVIPVSVRGESPYDADATWQVTVFVSAGATAGTTELTLSDTGATAGGSVVNVTDPADGPDSIELGPADLADLAPGLHGWSLWATDGDGHRQRVAGGGLTVKLAGVPS